VQVSHILIEKKTLKQWPAEQKQAFKVTVFLKPYRWMAEMGKLYFKDDSLNQLDDYLNRKYVNEKNQETDFLMNTSNTK